MIQGKDDSNEIYLEVVNENIVRALKSGQRAQSIKIKLTKKATACLTFEVRKSFGVSRSVASLPCTLYSR